MATNFSDTIPVGWGTSGGGRITASGNTAVEVTNRSRKTVYWCVTADDTVPTAEVAHGHPIEPGATKGVTLADGERLWRATRTQEVEVTTTQGATV